MRALKELVHKARIALSLGGGSDAAKENRKVLQWERQGRQGPAPHSVKQSNLRQIAETFGLKILVETGTFRGDMVQAMKANFAEIYSIELSDELYQAAAERFQLEKHIRIFHGDSGSILNQILPELKLPTLFWLDGHYSGNETARGQTDTPVLSEVEQIMVSQLPDVCLIIDDARYFGVHPEYPSFHQIEQLVHRYRPTMELTIVDDAIRVLPNTSPH